MELHFSSSPTSTLPYAVVATSLHLRCGSLTLKPDASATSADWSLIVPVDGHGGKQTVRGGQSAVLRYLARATSTSGNSAAALLYPEHQHPTVAALIDEWLALARRQPFQPADILAKHKTQASTTGTRSLVSGCEHVTLADFAVWGALQSAVKCGAWKVAKSGHGDDDALGAWFMGMQALSECVQAVHIVDEMVAAISAGAGASTGASKSPAGSAPVKNTKNTNTADKPQQPQQQAKPLSITDPNNALATFRLKIAQQLAPHVGMDAETLADYLEQPKGAVADVADYSLPVPRLRIKGDQAAIAADLVSKLKPDAYLAHVETAGTYLSFTLNKRTLRDMVLPTIRALSTTYGTNKSGEGKTVVVEFSSPNIAKPFHAGHLRSTIIGNFVRNVCDAQGMKTVAINYLGDWGKQYGLLAVGFDKFGSEEALQQDPIRHLFDVYVQVNNLAKEDPTIDDQARAYFKHMEEGDPSALALWKRFRDLSIHKYREIYARLNIRFDVYSGESLYAEGMKRAMARLEEKGLLTESDGARVVDLKKYKLGTTVVQKADGATLYLTRDIAAAWERHDQYSFDEMYYIVASQQNLHFQQLFKILDLAGFDEWSKRCTHLNFGMVSGMSTRKGTVVFLEDILHEAKSIMHAEMQKNPEHYNQIENPEEVADIIGVSAVIIQDFGARRNKDYDFNWSRMTSFEGDTGPYLQYAHTRLCSIERKYLLSLGMPVDTGVIPKLPFSKEGLAVLEEAKALELVLALSHYPDLIAGIPARQFEPNHLVSYLMSLCHKVSSCLEEVYVMNQPQPVAEARFWLYWSARVTVGNGMRLLGLKPLERM